MSDQRRADMIDAGLAPVQADALLLSVLRATLARTLDRGADSDWSECDPREREPEADLWVGSMEPDDY